jgi:hypothetical protein
MGELTLPVGSTIICHVKLAISAARRPAFTESKIRVAGGLGEEQKVFDLALRKESWPVFLTSLQSNQCVI